MTVRLSWSSTDLKVAGSMPVPFCPWGKTLKLKLFATVLPAVHECVEPCMVGMDTGHVYWCPSVFFLLCNSS